MQAMDPADHDRPCAEQARTRVALLAWVQSGALTEGLQAQGLEVSAVSLQALAAEQLPDRAQVLLVDLYQAPEALLEALDALPEQADYPILFNETAVSERPRAWMRRLANKLRALAGPPQAASAAAAPVIPAQPQRRPHVPMVWVLGASFGGPEAVKRFLDSMPAIPPVGFFLAQHIGDGFVDLLAAQLNRSTRFQVRPASDGQRPEPGTILVAPVWGRIRLDDTGVVRIEDDSDKRLYRPWIDGLMQEVAKCYGRAAGAIIFSGMGDDGARGARAVADAGGVVWAQDSASCAISSMPDSAAATGAVSRRGSPEALSAALVAYTCRQAGEQRA